MAGCVLFTQFRGDFDNVIDENLNNRAADAAALVATGEPHAALTQQPRAASRRSTAGGGALVATTPALAHARPAHRRRGAPRGSRPPARPPRGHAGGSHRGPRAPGTRFRDPARVAVAEPLDRRDRALDRLGELLLIVGPLALILATYAGYQVAGAALGPVERMRIRAEQITERDTAERLPVPATRDEIEALGRTLNDLLSRLDGALVRERRLLADASHELRTPLAVLLAEVQVALRGEA